MERKISSRKPRKPRQPRYKVKDPDFFENFTVIIGQTSFEELGGQGNWSYILAGSNKSTQRESGYILDTTRERINFICAIIALKRAIKLGKPIIYYSDYQLLARTFVWMNGWVRRDWKLMDGNPVRNLDLVKELYELKKSHKIKIRYSARQRTIVRSLLNRKPN